MKTNKDTKAAFYYTMDFQKRALFQIAKFFTNSIITNDIYEIKKFSPVFIFTADYACNILSEYFSGTEIKIMAIRHGAVNKYSKPEDDFNFADYVFGTEYEMRYLESGNVKPKVSFYITGNAWVDETFRLFKKEINKKAPTILFAPTYNPEISSANIPGRELYDSIKSVFKDFILIIKPHPAIIEDSSEHHSKNKNLFEQWIKYWEMISLTFKNVKFVRDTSLSISDVFNEADILISDRSSLIWEFVILERPIILFSSEQKLQLWDELKTDLSADNMLDVGSRYQTKEEFIIALQNIFEAHEGKYLQNQKKYKQFIYGKFQDGLSSKRISEQIKKIIVHNTELTFERAKHFWDNKNFIESFFLFTKLLNDEKYGVESRRHIFQFNQFLNEAITDDNVVFGNIETPTDYVYIKDSLRISGWVISRKYENMEMILTVNDYTFSPHRNYRMDVTNVHYELVKLNPNSGFYLDVDENFFKDDRNTIIGYACFEEKVFKVFKKEFMLVDNQKGDKEFLTLNKTTSNLADNKNMTVVDPIEIKVEKKVQKIINCLKTKLTNNFRTQNNNYDVLIPIYNAYDHVKTCVESVLRNTAPEHKIYLLDDASPDKRILPLLNKFAENDERVIVLSSENNLGFIGNMNRGFALSENDVIILNSDTQVTPNWIEKMHTCVSSNADAGIVSPLSNNATILSVPEMNASSKLPEGMSIDDFAELVFNVSDQSYPEIPTAVGFCMLIKRKVLDEVGFFDPIFGLGYGEENDLCERAKRKGYKILCCDNAYVHHYGEASFSFVDKIDEKRKINQKIFDKKWPNYQKEIFAFCRLNPLRKIQEKIYYKLNYNAKNHILHVMHNFDSAGGTELHTRKIIDGLANEFNSTVFYPASLGYIYTDAKSNKISENLREVKFAKENNLSVEHFGGLPADLYSNVIEENFTRFLVGGNYDLVHFQHLSGWSTLLLPLIAKKLGKKILLSLHDFYLLCPELNLIYSYTNKRCGKAIANPKDNSCLYCLGTKRYNRIPEKAQAIDDYLIERNYLIKKVLQVTDLLIAPSEFVKDKFLTAFKEEIKSKITVIPHGISNLEKVINLADSKKTRVTFLGNATDRKGIHIYLEAVKRLQGNEFEFEILGITPLEIKSKCKELKVNVKGGYETKELPKLLQKTDLVIIASIVDETFSLTLSEAMMMGIPVLSSDAGALKERIDNEKTGILFTSGSVHSLVEKLLLVKNKPALLHEIRKNLAELNVKSIDANIEDYREIYKNIIENKSIYTETGQIEKIIPTASIIVLTYNALHYTQKFYESILQTVTYNYEMIIIDNASIDGTKEYLKSISLDNKNVRLIFNDKNIGFPAAVNQGIQEAKGKYVLIANNDIVVTQGWLERLIEVAESDNRIGIVGPISNEVSGVQKDKEANYKTIDGMHQYAATVKEKNKNKVLQFPRVAFLCTLIKREVFNKIGGLDERFSPGNFEDDDFCLRAQLAGYKTVIAQDVFIHHYGSKSFKADGEIKYIERLKTNHKIFVDKWSADADEIWLRNKSFNHQRSLFISIEKDEFVKRFERAQKNIEDKEYDFALSELELAIDNFEFSNKALSIISKAELFILTANISLIVKDLEKAKLYFEETLKLNPTSSEACFGLGQVFYQAEMFEHSKTMLEWAIKNNPENQSAIEGLRSVNEILAMPLNHNSLLEVETNSVEAVK